VSHQPYATGVLSPYTRCSAGAGAGAGPTVEEMLAYLKPHIMSNNYDTLLQLHKSVKVKPL
jgi:hypothetical protein